MYNTPVALRFRNSSLPDDWYHPVYTSNCSDDRHVHYDILDEEGNFSFNFTFDGDLSGYNELYILVDRNNDACYLPVQQDGIITWCDNSAKVYFSLPESGHANINGSNQTIASTNLIGTVNEDDGRMLRALTVSREYLFERYNHNLPYSMQPIYICLNGHDPDAAGRFIQSSSGISPRIEIYDNSTDFTTLMHEYGHYVNYKMWGDYLFGYDVGCTNPLGENTPGMGKVYKEGWAIFFSYASKNYGFQMYGDELRIDDDNTEIGPFENPRFENIRYTSEDPRISAFACYLWSLYDSYPPSNFEAAIYDGDNDDITDLSLRVLETMRTPQHDCPQWFHDHFKMGLNTNLRSSIDKLFDNINVDPTVHIRSAQKYISRRTIKTRN